MQSVVARSLTRCAVELPNQNRGHPTAFFSGKAESIVHAPIITKAYQYKAERESAPSKDDCGAYLFVQRFEFRVSAIHRPNFRAPIDYDHIQLTATPTQQQLESRINEHRSRSKVRPYRDAFICRGSDRIWDGEINHLCCSAAHSKPVPTRFSARKHQCSKHLPVSEQHKPLIVSWRRRVHRPERTTTDKGGIKELRLAVSPGVSANQSDHHNRYSTGHQPKFRPLTTHSLRVKIRDRYIRFALL